MASNDNDDKDRYRHRFGDVADEPLQMLSPIEGFQNKPLVSLEDAVKPLVQRISDIEIYASEAKENMHMPLEYDLSPDEAAAIRLYTMEWKNKKPSLYRVLNENLRDEDRRVLIDWFYYLKLLITALMKIPSTPRHLFRGVNMNLSAKYPDGGTFVWWAFSSCSDSPAVSQSFCGKQAQGTLFEIDCYSGKDVRRISKYQKENEVLLIAATQFQVTSKVDQSNGVTIIRLKETEPKYPLIEKVQVTKPSSMPADKPTFHAPTKHLAHTPKTEPPKAYQLQSIAHQSERNPRIRDQIDQVRPHSRAIFENERMDQGDVRDIVDRIITEKRCPKIEIHNAELIAGSIKALGEGIRRSTHLDEVDLSGNRLSSNDVSFLVEELSVQERHTVESSACCGFGTKQQVRQDNWHHRVEFLSFFS